MGEKKYISFIFLMVVCSLMSCSLETKIPCTYNITWNTPSKDALDCMPLSGRKGAGANVWVQDGSLWMYLGHNGAYDSQSKLLKLGCIRITPESTKLGDEGFSQKLNLEDGSITISQNGLKFSLWFAEQTLIIESESKSAEQLNVAYGTWREKDKSDLVYDMWFRKGNFKADHIITDNTGVVWYHDNRDEVVDLATKATAQGIPADAMFDATSKRVFGGAMVVKDGLADINSKEVRWQYWNGKAWEGKTVKSKEHLITVNMGAGIEADPQSWKDKANSLLKKSNLSKAKAEEKKLWDEFWSRSYVVINQNATSKDDPGYLVGQNYQLFRYMLACNRDGEHPLLFNGGIFTVDNVPNKITGNNNDELARYEPAENTPDYRRWTYCGFMSQNQRWIGRPTIAGGDMDMFTQTPSFYRNREKVAAARAKNNNSKGVVYTESMNIWGLEPIDPRPNGFCGAEHLTYHFSMMLDHAWMTLEAHTVMGYDISKDLDWIAGTVLFYDSYYRVETLKRTGKELNDKGKLVIYPSNAVEVAIGATNPIDAVSGLTRITETLLTLDGIKGDTRKELERILPTIPVLPMGERNGKMSLLPVDSYEKEFNPWEPVEMFAAYPFKMVSITHPETRQLLIDTYETVPEHRARLCNREDLSWMPNVANAAAMALPELAEKRAIYKMANNETPQSRFPAFFGPGHDWIPDHNWGGSGMVGIQEMLMSCDPYGDGKIYLLHAWPLKWNVDFKLHAPQQTVVSVKVKDGKVVSLKVTPQSRAKDIIIDSRFKYSID